VISTAAALFSALPSGLPDQPARQHESSDLVDFGPVDPFHEASARRPLNKAENSAK
jgi:hypothetical protein